ncbi:hypothetical protein ACFQWB_13360 [Paenibacillus thermoaerophilus]|uniref:Uncharacterized protein n=1 Tax=Paenibacillus thermoaerophilus TaxID=1215385 RepID=A0ABW2V7R8_9BACL|nr:hypothetical protein [Paenibacillus thermoaerophilus]
MKKAQSLHELQIGGKPDLPDRGILYFFYALEGEHTYPSIWDHAEPLKPDPALSC